MTTTSSPAPVCENVIASFEQCCGGGWSIRRSLSVSHWSTPRFKEHSEKWLTVQPSDCTHRSVSMRWASQPRRFLEMDYFSSSCCLMKVYSRGCERKRIFERKSFERDCFKAWKVLPVLVVVLLLTCSFDLPPADRFSHYQPLDVLNGFV